MNHFLSIIAISVMSLGTAQAAQKSTEDAPIKNDILRIVCEQINTENQPGGRILIFEQQYTNEYTGSQLLNKIKTGSTYGVGFLMSDHKDATLNGVAEDKKKDFINDLVKKAEKPLAQGKADMPLNSFQFSMGWKYRLTYDMSQGTAVLSDNEKSLFIASGRFKCEPMVFDEILDESIELDESQSISHSNY